ncbi:hypothetical protein [Roseibium sp. MMSF_3544]|nr:hypothetical protein [Roseibium sp. MMSF_3544]
MVSIDNTLAACMSPPAETISNQIGSIIAETGGEAIEIIAT